jgi:hypothetical protein
VSIGDVAAVCGFETAATVRPYTVCWFAAGRLKSVAGSNPVVVPLEQTSHQITGTLKVSVFLV